MTRPRAHASQIELTIALLSAGRFTALIPNVGYHFDTLGSLYMLIDAALLHLLVIGASH